VAGRLEIGRHAGTHDPETDESDFHDGFLPAGILAQAPDRLLDSPARRA